MALLVPTTLYERIGAEKVERLVAVFYARVDSDPVIRPLYGKTLSCAIDGLTKFMITWLGGPPVYDLPAARLRRRHVPFAIDARARDAWLANMKAAVREVGIPAAEAALLMAHLEFGAKALVNVGKPPKTKNLSQKITGPRWAGNGPDARPSDEAIQRRESLRSENDADGPFPAQPEGTPGISAPYFVAPPQRLVQLESLRRRAASGAEIPGVAAPLSFEIDSKPCPVDSDKFDARLAEQWNRMADAETLFDAVSRGDLALVRSMLPRRLVPHAVLMSHALAEWLDPVGRKDRRFGRRSRQVKPLEVIELLLAERELDCDQEAVDDLGRYRHLQAMIEAYCGLSRMIDADSPLHASMRAATYDRFISEVERDRSCVRLLGSRGQSLLHDAAMAGEPELAAVLIRSGADPDAREAEGHTPLYRARAGNVARVLIAAGASVDVVSGPTRGTPLHQAARRGSVSVAQALLDHGATIDARDAKHQTPLRRAVNCRQVQIVRLLVRQGADPHLADRRGVTPLDIAHTDEMKQAMADGSG